ncbi:MAG TPA: DUF1499 domain-containing protein [Mariprofundaceae bacterium]|nr:DUF1499 domain-containing protein [Mariprofundaceae bacterium]
MLLALAVLVVVVLAAGFALGIRSQAMAPATGLQNGQLRPCPDSPNCVCSEAYADPQHAIAPLSPGKMPLARAWAALQQIVVRRGGHIESVDAGYLHATFTSRLFRFVDDVEARPDTEAGVIHIRSASRVGRSDLGVNRQRVEAIRQELVSTLQTSGSD